MKEKLSTASELIISILSVCYLVGMITTNFYLAKYNISNSDFIEIKYFFIGGISLYPFVIFIILLNGFNYIIFYDTYNHFNNYYLNLLIVITKKIILLFFLFLLSIVSYLFFVVPKTMVKKVGETVMSFNELKALLVPQLFFLGIPMIILYFLYNEYYTDRESIKKLILLNNSKIEIPDFLITEKYSVINLYIKNFTKLNINDEKISDYTRVIVSILIGIFVFFMFSYLDFFAKFIIPNISQSFGGAYPVCVRIIKDDACKETLQGTYNNIQANESEIADTYLFMELSNKLIISDKKKDENPIAVYKDACVKAIIFE